MTGTSTGLYSTSLLDGENTVWSQEGSETIGNMVIDDIEGRHFDGFIVAGSHGNGIYSATISSDELSIDEPLSPSEFSVGFNYPNPFNPITLIEYDLPNNGFVNMAVYDMMGRLVKTLLNGSKPAGYNQVLWHATNDNNEPVSAGVYIYVIQFGNSIETKKMILLK